MRTLRLIDRIGPNPVLESWGYADAYLRAPERRAPIPIAPFYWKTPKGWEPGAGLYVPLECAIGLVQTVKEQHTANSATPGCNIAALSTGSLVIVCYSSQRSGGIQTVSSVTDSGGANVYTQFGSGTAHSTTATSLIMNDVWYTNNATSGPTSVTVTPNAGSGSDEYVCVYEVSGCATSSVEDGGNVLSDQSTANPTGPTVTTTTTTGFIVTILDDPHGITGGTTGGFTSDFIDGAGANSNGAFSHLITAAAGANGTSWTSSAGNWASSIAAFKGPGGGASAWGPLIGLRNNRLVVAN